MTEFTPHEQQQIRDGVKTSHRVLIEPQPELRGDGKMIWCPPCAKYNVQLDMWLPSCVWNPDLPVMETGAAGIVEFAPYKPGDRIPADGGEIVVGDVRAEQLKDMTDKDAIAEGFLGVNCYMVQGFTKLCSHDGELPIEQFSDRWRERYPEHPFAYELLVFVLKGLGWEASE